VSSSSALDVDEVKGEGVLFKKTTCQALKLCGEGHAAFLGLGTLQCATKKGIIL